MRTLFIGGTRRGFMALKALVDVGADVVGIISLRQHEHEFERYEAPIRNLAQRSGIRNYETTWIKDRDYARLIAEELRPDVAFVVGCRVLIPEDIYSIPPRGMLVVHDSLLPRYRGFAPLNWSIINGEDHTGVTLFRLNDLMDGGDIVAQKRVEIGPDDTAGYVNEQVCRAVAELIRGVYPMLLQGRIPGVKQDYAVGSYACSRSPADGMIDWAKSTREIYNQVRGLSYPYPGAFTFHDARKLIVWEARLLDTSFNYEGRIPGRVVQVSKESGHVDVLTGDGVLRLCEVQLEGGQRTEPASVICSVRSTLGVRVVDLLERVTILEHRLAALTDSHATDPATLGRSDAPFPDSPAPDRRLAEAPGELPGDPRPLLVEPVQKKVKSA